MHSKNNKGFTLIEILIAAVILGMLAALVGPKVIGLKENGFKAEMINSIKTFIDHQENHMNDVGQYAATLTALNTATGYSADDNVTVAFTVAHTQYGFTVTATHSKSPWACGQEHGASGPGGTQYSDETNCSSSGVSGITY